MLTSKQIDECVDKLYKKYIDTLNLHSQLVDATNKMLTDGRLDYINSVRWIQQPGREMESNTNGSLYIVGGHQVWVRRIGACLVDGCIAEIDCSKKGSPLTYFRPRWDGTLMFDRCVDWISITGSKDVDALREAIKKPSDTSTLIRINDIFDKWIEQIKSAVECVNFYDKFICKKYAEAKAKESAEDAKLVELFGLEDGYTPDICTGYKIEVIKVAR